MDADIILGHSGEEHQRFIQCLPIISGKSLLKATSTIVAGHYTIHREVLEPRTAEGAIRRV